MRCEDAMRGRRRDLGGCEAREGRRTARSCGGKGAPSGRAPERGERQRFSAGGRSRISGTAAAAAGMPAKSASEGGDELGGKGVPAAGYGRRRARRELEDALLASARIAGEAKAWERV